MTMGIHFDSHGSIQAPVPGLLVYLGIYVELEQEGLNVALVLDAHEDGFKILV